MIACRCRRRWPRPTLLGALVLGAGALGVVLVALALVLPRAAGAQTPGDLSATVTPAPAYTATVEPSRAVVTSRGGARDGVERWRPLLAEYADWDVDEGLRVVGCESRGDPDAVNRTSGAAGLLQLLGWGWLAERLTGIRDVLVPWVNVAVAHWLWADSGGTFAFHWHASRTCWR